MQFGRREKHKIFLVAPAHYRSNIVRQNNPATEWQTDRMIPLGQPLRPSHPLDLLWLNRMMVQSLRSDLESI